MSRWTIRRLGAELGEDAVAWDTLNRRLFKANPMLDSRFVNALIGCFGAGKVVLAVFREEAVIEAMCLLLPRRFGLWASFLPAQAQIAPVLLTRNDIVDELIRALPGMAMQVDFLCNDPEFGDLSHGGTLPGNVVDHALTMCIDLSGGVQQYWARRSDKLKKNLTRYEHRLALEQLEMRLAQISAPEQMAAAFERYAALETKGWKGKIGTSLTLEHAQGKFYQRVLDRFAETAGSVIYELWIGDQLASSRLTIAVGSTLVMLKTTYDESLNRFAPGRLLLKQVIDCAFERYPGGTIEFYTNADANQLAWATGHRWISHVSFFRNAAAKRFFETARGARRVAMPPTQARTPVETAVSTFKHPADLPLDVRRLFDNAEKRSFEFGLGWFENLVNTVYPDHAGVHIHVLRHKGLPVAAIPILVNAAGRWNHAESLSNYYSALYAPAFAPELKARHLVPLLQAIWRQHAPLDSLKFMPMDPQSAEYNRLLEALKLAGLLPFKFFCFGNWYLKVENDWAHYLKERSGTLRNTIKRMGKKFTADGGRLDIVTGGAALESGLQAYESVYASSWKGAEPYVNFIPGLVRNCAARGWLRLGIAWLGDTPIAAQLWIVSNGKASIYKVAYHEDHKAYAPGTLLTALLMQHVIEQDRVDEVDYLIGDDPYKKTWMSARRERWGLMAYNPRSIRAWPGIARELGGRILRHAKKKFKRNSSAETEA